MLLFLTLLPFISQASAYWMEVKGSGKVNEAVTIQVIYGNIDESGIRHRQNGKELGLTGDFSIYVIDEKGTRTDVVIRMQKDCWEGSFTPAEKGTYQILGINDKHPVVDRSKTGGKNILPVDYLCAAYNVGNVQTTVKPQQFLDLITIKNDKQVVVKAFQNGKVAVKGTTLRVFNPENWEKELVINEAGEAVFMPTMKGLYVIRQDWVDNKPGNYKEVSYTSVRYRCNYCLLVQ